MFRSMYIVTNKSGEYFAGHKTSYKVGESRETWTTNIAEACRWSDASMGQAQALARNNGGQVVPLGVSIRSQQCGAVWG